MSDRQGIVAKVALPSFQVGRNAVWIGAAVAGIGAFYWNGLVALPGNWAVPEYSHGYFIPLIAIYLFLRSVSTGFAAPRWTGVGLTIAILGLLFGFLANLANIPDVVIYSMIICIAGIAIAGLGLNNAGKLAAPLLYLIFMLRLPSPLYWGLSIKLQFISSYLGVWFISFLGIPVYLDGNIIDLGSYKLQVAEACSGLRYLFPLASFSFLFAVLYRGPMWHRLVIFLSAAPITVFMNSFRLGVIGVLVDQFGIEQAEGFLHAFEGWVIFIACVAILYAEAALLQRLRGRNAIPIHRMLNLDLLDRDRYLAALSSFRPPRSLMLAAGAVLVAGLAWQATPARAAVHVVRDGFDAFPLRIGAWTGSRGALDPEVEHALKPTDYLQANFYSSDAQSVSLLLVYFDSQSKGNAIHSPSVCLPASGWEVSRWTQFPTGVRTRSGELLRVNRAILQKGLDRLLVYYWFEQQGRSVTSDYAAKIYTLVDAVKRGRTDGALVRLITPITGDAVAASDDRLRQFLQLIMPKLPSYVPG
jgi:exosortase D (VPLPA-CTERM-specific)